MFGPGRVSFHYGWEDPSVSVDAACSSSHVAIQVACSALLSKNCDMAIAGGANIMTSQDIYAGLSKSNFISKTGSCKTWSTEADGYCRGDAVAVLALKRLNDAMADRDPVLAVIKNVSTNHSAKAHSITHPHAETQAALFRTVLRNSGVQARDVDFIEMHGTGTQAGDVQETKSVAMVFGTERSLDNPLYVGGVKANVGHSESASGVTPIVKAVMMFQKNCIPPHIGIKCSIDPTLPPLASMNIKIRFEKKRLGIITNEKRRAILVNNFNAAGGNTCLLLEDGMDFVVEEVDPRTARIVTISARTKKSLVMNLERLSQHLRSN